MFRTPSPRGFDYRPRYWDEQRERKQELQQLVQEARTGVVNNDRRAERLRKQVAGKWSSRRGHGKSASTMQSARFLIIATALSGLVWLFLNW